MKTRHGYRLMTTLFPVVVPEMTYIGGDHPEPWIRGAYEKNAKDGTLFGRPAEQISDEELELNLKELNIRYLFLFSERAKQMVESRPEWFEFEAEKDIYGIYEYRQANRNYVVYAGNASAWVSKRSPSRWKLKVNASEGAEILLSTSYSQNWRAFEGEEELEVRERRGLISIAVPPAEGERTIWLVYTESTARLIGRWISLFVWLGLGLFLVASGRNY